MGNPARENETVAIATKQVLSRLTGRANSSSSLITGKEHTDRDVVLALQKNAIAMANKDKQIVQIVEAESTGSMMVSDDKPIDQMGIVRLTASMNAVSEEEFELGEDNDMEKDDLLHPEVIATVAEMVLTSSSDGHAEGAKVVTQKDLASSSEEKRHTDFPPLPRKQNNRFTLNRPAANANAARESSKSGQNRPNAWANRPRINTGVGSKLWKITEQGPLLFKRSEMPSVEETWGFCLVGRFAGRFPGIKALDNIRKSWNVKHSLRTEASFLIFGFESEEDKDNVLKAGPYFAYDKPLLLKTMPSLFAFNKDALATIPIWVRIHGLPTELWSKESLSRVASRIGQPLFVDPVTEQRKRGSFARVLVEVNFSKSVLRELTIEYDDGLKFECPLIYENEQVFCSICNGFGHLEKRCLFKPHEDQDKEEIKSKQAAESAQGPLNNTLIQPTVESDGKEHSPKQPEDKEASTKVDTSGADDNVVAAVRTQSVNSNMNTRRMPTQLTTSNKFAVLQDDITDKGKDKIDGLTASEDSDDTEQSQPTDDVESKGDTDDIQSELRPKEKMNSELIDKGGKQPTKPRRSTRQTKKDNSNQKNKGAGTPSRGSRR